MNYIWAGMILLSLVCAVATGRVQELSDSVLSGAGEAVELLFGILGIMCFWSGMMEIAKRSGMCDMLARLFSPVLRLLFRDVDSDSPAMKYMSLNISANLLGLGNAATPFGLRAMEQLQEINPIRHRASDSELLFVVMNTASLQLIPTTLGAYRARFGSVSPFDILPCVWLSSVAALCAGIAVAKVFNLAGRREDKRRKRR